MAAAWGSPEVLDDGNTTQASYVQANADRDSTQELENGDEMRETEMPERPEKPRRKRGRIAKDPLNQTFLFECRDADDLETMLRDFLKDTTSPPEHTTVEFRFPSSAAFMVYPPGHSQAIKDPLQRVFSRKAVSVIEALQPTYNPKDQTEKQRSIAKICVETVAKADGFKYGFNNNWISKEDGASRFSYFCNDSSLNKARAGNPAASNRVAHKKAQKPVYECEGTIAVKFWASKQMLEVLYKHIPCHDTYDARAPIPRKGTRRRLLMEVFEPAKLPAQRTPGGQGNQVKYEKRKAKLDSLQRGRAQSGGNSSSSVPPDPSREGSQHSAEPALPSLSASNEPTKFPTEKLQDLQTTCPRSRPTPKKRKSGGPNIPGTMSGFMDGHEIRIGEERPNEQQATAKKRRNSKKGQLEQDAINLEDDGIAVSASAESAASLGRPASADRIVAPNAPLGQPSELDILKAKLAQAEQQIKRLEAANSSPAPPPPQPSYYIPPGYYQPPLGQYQCPPQQQWQTFPGYGPAPRLATSHYTTKPAANLQFKHTTCAGFGVLKPPKTVPNSPRAMPQSLASIAGAAAGVPAETNSSSRDKNASSQTVNEGTAGDKPATAQEDAAHNADKEVIPAPSEQASAETSVDATKATSESATSTPASDTTSYEALVAANPGAAQSSHNRHKSSLASGVALSMNQVKFYSPKSKPAGGPS